MSKHQAKPCQVEDESETKHPIQIHFPSSQLVYISEFLKNSNITVHNNEDGSHHIITNAGGLKIFERQLYFAQISLYNIEQWYSALQAIKVIFFIFCYIFLYFFQFFLINFYLIFSIFYSFLFFYFLINIFFNIKMKNIFIFKFILKNYSFSLLYFYFYDIYIIC